jgi:hypothetical protein
MMAAKSGSKMAEFYGFFEKFGTERLNGLGESYFVDLSDSEKEEAWKFLQDGFESSAERITGLYNLDKARAVPLFKEAIELPLGSSPYPAEQKAIESNRLLMLRYINSVEPDKKYITAMCEFSKSQFEDVRTEFAQSMPVHQITHEAVDALKGMIFTETETVPLTSAITKLMVIHGMEFDRKSSVYKSLYMSLRSDDPKEKAAAMSRLERNQSPDYI